MDQAGLDSLNQNANNLSAQAIKDTQTATTVPQMLTDALNTKFNDPSNPLIKQRDSSLSTYLNAGTDAAAKYLPANQNGAVYDPVTRRQLESGYETSASVPLFSIQSLIANAYGGIGEIAKNVGTAFGAQADAETKNAALARQQYEDAYKQYMDQQQLSLEYARIAESRRASDPSQSSSTYYGMFDSQDTAKYFNSLPKEFRSGFLGSAQTGGPTQFSSADVQRNYDSWNWSTSQADVAQMAAKGAGKLNNWGAFNNWWNNTIEPKIDGAFANNPNIPSYDATKNELYRSAAVAAGLWR